MKCVLCRCSFSRNGLLRTESRPEQSRWCQPQRVEAISTSTVLTVAPKETPRPLAATSLLPDLPRRPLPFAASKVLLSVLADLLVLDVSYRRKRPLWGFATGLAHGASRARGPSVLRQVLALPGQPVCPLFDSRP